MASLSFEEILFQFKQLFQIKFLFKENTNTNLGISIPITILLFFNRKLNILWNFQN